MNKIKQILITLVVAIFTVLNIYKLQMPVPYGDFEYAKYAHNYLMLTGICFILVCGTYFTGYKNRLIESLLIVNIGVYAVLTFKAFIKVAGEHKYYDWTFAGLFVIYATCHLIPNRTRHRKKK